jgi:hypothetical protein
VLSTFFDTMPSAPSRQACAKTIAPSSTMCSLNRMPALVLGNSLQSVEPYSQQKCGSLTQYYFTFSPYLSLIDALVK